MQTPALARAQGAGAEQPGPLIVVHGGAGNIRPEHLDEQDRRAYRQGLREALEAGQAILQKGGTSMAAVEAAIRTMEANPSFNAGKGSVLNLAGFAEMDASLMRGDSGLAGAVTGVTRVKHPISAARAVMEHTPHVMLMSSGTAKLAEQQGLALVDSSYFVTEHRKRQLERLLRRQEQQLDHDAQGEEQERTTDAAALGSLGTVGAVAMDRDGNLAAGTSTGGMSNKFEGRIGDSPIIGAGTYAENGVCAVSCTGHGEYFMRLVLAHDLAARMKYSNRSLRAAGQQVIHEYLAEAGGAGGLIAIDPRGHIIMPFNTAGMFRGHLRAGEEPVIQFFGAE